MKSKILTLLLGVCVVMSGCSSEKNSNSDNNSNSSSNTNSSQQKSETKKSETKTSSDKKVYGLNEEWIVDGSWKLKINSVTTTEYRNQFSEDNPAQVVIIDYTYENIGYTSDIQDLYMSPSTVIDGGRKVAKSYPASIKNYPQATPEGAIMENAQEAYGLQTESSEITIKFEKYDQNSKKHVGEFKVPVTK